MIGRLLAMAALALTLVSVATTAQPQTFERDKLAIETAGGAQQFAVELAVTSDQRQQGLMFRERLPAGAGMLFLYPAARPVAMWMKNTLIPLDMLFIGDDGRILHIAERTIPGSTATISSMQPARAVLELNGGSAARLHIQVGDRVLYRTFGTAD
ncbi:MAG TPA: DUF192 domain-containing protein [Candidatus Angelobacter sp.]|nr:DUF192 domain-containing protein [Candidatus Angelobacter sp.]